MQNGERICRSECDKTRVVEYSETNKVKVESEYQALVHACRNSSEWLENGLRVPGRAARRPLVVPNHTILHAVYASIPLYTEYFTLRSLGCCDIACDIIMPVIHCSVIQVTVVLVLLDK
jgi:hypothetical protein